MTDIFTTTFNGLDMVVLVALATCAFLCSWAIARAGKIADRQAKRDASRKVVVEDLYRTYRRRRYGGRHWPGKKRS